MAGRAPRIVIIGVLSVALLGAVLSGWAGFVHWSEPPEGALGRRLYAEHCASCHGPKLEGQPNWQEPLADGRMPAPPHDATGHTWHHSDEELFTMTKRGLAALVPGYQSAMPAFAGVLTDDEIRAVLAFIKGTWPKRERDYQKTRGKAGR